MGVISNILRFVGLSAGPSRSWHVPVNTIKMITADEENQKVYVYIDGKGQDLANHDYIEITAPNQYICCLWNVCFSNRRLSATGAAANMDRVLSLPAMAMILAAVWSFRQGRVTDLSDISIAKDKKA